MMLTGRQYFIDFCLGFMDLRRPSLFSPQGAEYCKIYANKSLPYLIENK